MNIFISYDTEDLNTFRIHEIAEYLENKPEIENAYYWDRDSVSDVTIPTFMEQCILDSEIILAISSENSLVSESVNLELDFGILTHKRFIPIFQNIENVRPLIKVYRGVNFNINFDDFLSRLMHTISGERIREYPRRSERTLEVQNLFDRLKRLITRLFNPNTETSYTFTSRLLRSEEMQEYFGITVRQQDYLDDQKVGFIDGLYYIIPNSKTLRIRRETGGEETLLTRNNLIEITEEGIINNLNSFFLVIVDYVRREHNIEIN